MWTKEQRVKIKALCSKTLPDEILGLLIGTVLGDGHLAPLHNNSDKAYLKIGQKSFNFVDFKLKLFSETLCVDPEIKKWVYKGKKSYHLNTIAHPDIYSLYKKMYSAGVKIITEDVFEQLTVAGLALWYFDDGHYSRDNNSYYLSTCNFTLSEHHLMRTLLRKKFNIYTSIIRNQAYYKLYIAARSRLQFENLIKSFVPECMFYKCSSNIQSPQRLNVNPS